MSVKHIEAAWTLDLPMTRMLVLQAMVIHADKTGGRIWPSQELIAWKTGLHVNTVSRAIRDLVAKGEGVLEVVEEAKWHRPAKYQFRPERGTRKPPRPDRQTHQPAGSKTHQGGGPEGEVRPTSQDLRPTSQDIRPTSQDIQTHHSGGRSPNELSSDPSSDPPSVIPNQFNCEHEWVQVGPARHCRVCRARDVHEEAS